jgi:hypothetical protein
MNVEAEIVESKLVNGKKKAKAAKGAIAVA